ncbi:MAG: spondin domain-containing protein [Gammaproteobacteria bacterium]|nr:spondin domain-containing protein [Gammaproteobacteria bacterium]
MTLKPLVKSLFIATTICVSSLAAAGEYLRVTVTNLTHGQIFTPILVASHSRNKQLLFKAGQPASKELAALAEGGDTVPLAEALGAKHSVKGVADSGGPLMPGATTTITVPAHGAKRVSLAAMLIPTNDAFVSLNNVRAPLHGSITYTAVAYDAGSELNDESCLNIPGPFCGGAGGSPDAGGEGYVHVHAGIHGIADVPAEVFDWRNPVAQVTVKRVRY